MTNPIIFINKRKEDDDIMIAEEEIEVSLKSCEFGSSEEGFGCPILCLCSSSISATCNENYERYISV